MTEQKATESINGPGKSYPHF